jgi:hypothetical protein
MDKIKNSPSIDLDRPVSRQAERDYYGYYGYPYYWGYGGLWGMGGYPAALASGPYDAPRDRPGEPPADPHLRSVKDVTGYHVEATDGAIGHVSDFIVDDETWQVRFMAVDTANWWPGKTVVLAPEWATRISWVDRKVYLGMTRNEIRSSPPWSGTYSVDSAYAEQLARHYGGIPGWSGKDGGMGMAPTAGSGAPALVR